MDANQDGNGVSPWAVVGIMIATIVGIYVVRKIWSCLNCRTHKHAGGHFPMITVEPRHPPPPNADHPKGPHEDRLC